MPILFWMACKQCNQALPHCASICEGVSCVCARFTASSMLTHVSACRRPGECAAAESRRGHSLVQGVYAGLPLCGLSGALVSSLVHGLGIAPGDRRELKGRYLKLPGFGSIPRPLPDLGSRVRRRPAATCCGCYRGSWQAGPASESLGDSQTVALEFAQVPDPAVAATAS